MRPDPDGSVNADLRRAFLIESVSTAEVIADGAEPLLAYELKGRVNGVQERQTMLCLASAAVSASMVHQTAAAAKRMAEAERSAAERPGTG